MSVVNKEVVEKLSSFGEQIISPVEGVPIIEPLLELTPEEFIALLAMPSGDAASPLELGIFNVIGQLISSLWEKLSEEQKDVVKTHLMKFTSFKLHPKALARLADACVSVYVKCDKKWDEIAKVIFESDVTDLTGFLFVKFMSLCAPEFIDANMAKIVSLVSTLLPTSSITVQTSLIVVLSSLDVETIFKEDAAIIEKMWAALLHIIKEEPERAEFVCPIIAEILEDAPEAAKISPACVAAAIDEVKDMPAAQILMYIIPFLTGELLVKLLHKLLQIMVTEIEAKNEVPNEIIEEIDNAPLDLISEENTKLIAEFIKDKVDTHAGLALFAPFSAHIAAVFGQKEMFALVEKCLTQDPLTIALGLKIFECVSNYSDDLEFELPDQVMYKFVDLLTGDSETVKCAAFGTLSALIDNDLFIHDDHLNALLKAYPRIKDDEIIRFYKLLRRMLRVEGVSDSVVEKLFDFAVNTITKTTSPLIKAQCLSIVSCAASQDADELVHSEIKTLSPIAVELVKSGEECALSYASRALVLFISLAPDICRRPILALLPKFFAIATGQQGVSVKVQANVSVALASIIVRVNVQKDYTRIVELIETMVETNEPHLVSAAGIIAEIMRSTNSLDLVKRIYTALNKVALQTKDKLIFNSVLNAIRKIIKGFDIPIEATKPLFTSILTGAHPVFNRRPPSIFMDKDTKIYAYLKGCALRYKDLIGDIAKVVEWCDEIPPAMFPAYLEIIEHLVDQKIVKGENATRLVKIFMEKVGQNKDSLDEIILGIVMMLMKQDAAIVDKDKLAGHLLLLWQESNDQELNGWRAMIGTGILELCALGAEMTEEVVEDILAEYPYDPEFGKAEDMSRAIITMMDDPQKKWQQVGPAAAKTMIDLLLSKKEKLDEHGLDASLIKEMKRVLKRVVKGTPALDRELKKDFQRNKAMLNSYNRLLK